jgi:predicted DNA-binding protein YlxM (UPF0122 family)
VKARLIDRVLCYRQLIGWRRWGMLQLYYRAGLSQQEIAEIFNVNRQMVTYEMKRAFDMVATHIESQRRYGLPKDDEE